MKRVVEQGYFLAEGMHYLQFIEDMHQVLKPKWYLEIGTQTGASLKLSSAKSIAVDPGFRLSHEVMQNKPELYAYQETSDMFFKTGRLNQLRAKIDIAFLDGMHLFEFLLRDFIGTEKFCSKSGVILLHDCLPWNGPMAMRDRDLAETSSWTGDVWKIVPVLQKYRPDLEIDIVDAAPTGLVIVNKLDPTNTVLEENYERILNEFKEITLEYFGVDRYFSSLDVQSAAHSRWRCAFPHELGKGWRTNPDISIKIAPPTRGKMTRWGDYHYAQSLARAFCRLGHKAFVCSAEDWYVHQERGGLDLVLRGRANFRRVPGRLCFIWAISKKVRRQNYNNADHVFWASKQLYDQESNGRGAGISTLLPQAFDQQLMKPPLSEDREGVAFVGRARAGFERSSLFHAVEAKEDLRIWGPNWIGSEFGAYVVAESVSNESVPEIYQTSEIVLNDHTPMMKSYGFLSNRVFDTLACGAIPISEDVGWLPDDIADFVYVYQDQESFNASLALARSEPSSKQLARKKLSKKLPSLHSFDARAKDILRVLKSMS